MKGISLQTVQYRMSVLLVNAMNVGCSRCSVGRDSSVGIGRATGWNIRGSNLGEEEGFPYSSRLVPEPTQLPILWIPGLFPTPT
jgi:hypothetical protein